MAHVKKSTLSLDSPVMGSQTCLSGRKAGQESDNHKSPAQKVLSMLKSIWATRQTQDTSNDTDLLVKTTIRELAIYVVFLIILCILTFGMTNSVNFYYTGMMNDLFTGSGDTTFADIASMNDFWDVMEGPMMDAIYWETWYNDENATGDMVGSIYFENKVLGLPRLRQVRVKKNSCVVHAKFQNTIRNCYDAFSGSSESKEPFGIYETNQTNMENTAFFYQSSSKLDTSSHEGIMATYGGGGYVKDLAHTKDETLAILDELKSNLWLDRGTRAVILDLTVYNANINMFCQVKLLVEFPPTGGAMTSSTFRTVKLIRYVTTMDYFVLACEGIFILFILYYTIEEALEIRIHRLQYFKEFWNILDILVLFISYLCILFNVYRIIKVDQLLDSILKNLDQYANFEFMCYWQTQFNNAIALTVFLSWVKIFKYISFNKTMNQLSRTLGNCAQDILGFSVMFGIVFFAFAQLGFLLFGAYLEDYKTMTNAMFTLFRLILGDFDFVSLQQASRILGPVYFIAYVFFVFFVLLNMFLAIINDTYSEVKGDPDSQTSEFELGDYFKRGYEKMLTKLNVKRDRIIDIQEMMKTADKDGDNKLNFEELRADLRNRGYTDIEIETFFAQYDTDGDMVLNFNEQENVKNDLNQQSAELDKEFERIKNEKDETEEQEAELAKIKASLVSFKEFNIVAKRVDTMEGSIGNIVSKIDNVLAKFEAMEKAKLKRREAMTKLLDQLNNTGNMDDEHKKKQIEKLIRDELEKWDEPLSAGKSRGPSGINA